MNYELGENEIVTRLNNHFNTIGKADKFVAALMPETDAEAKEYEANFPKTCVAVQYINSEFQKPTALGLVKQDETVTFRLLMEGRKLRGEGGVFAIKKEIIKSLLGFRLSDADPLYIGGEGNQQFEAGQWVPYLDFECRTMNVQVIAEPEEIGGPLTGIEY